MFKYTQFDFINKTKKSKLLLKFLVNIIIIIFILILLLLNLYTKDDVKIISSNSRRIINTLNNYTETMSDFIHYNEEELNEIKNIRLSIDYLKTIKKQEIEQEELKKQILKQQEIEQEELNEIKNIRLSIDYLKTIKKQEIEQEELKKQILKQQEIEQEELKKQEYKQIELNFKREKAFNLIKSYIPNYNNLINLISSYLNHRGYSNDFNCLQKFIKINNEELFNRLIDINYDTLEVSFNYLDKNNKYYENTDNILTTHLYSKYDENNIYYNYSDYIYKNYKENIIKNPIYQIIKEQLEINYLYTEPNLTDYYNNKSRYFEQSLSYDDYLKLINSYFNVNWEKYYEIYEKNTHYSYYKHIVNNHDSPYMYYLELLIQNEIIINNPNPINIYNKHPYKFICNIPSKTMNNKGIINNHYYHHGISYLVLYNKINISEEILNNIYDNNSYSSNYELGYNYYRNNHNLNYFFYDYYYNILDLEYSRLYYNTFPISYNDNYGYYYYYSSITNYELDKNRGTRMIKHNLTNNMPPYYFNFNNRVAFFYKYHIEKVYINFPIISIYDEYEYIQLLISNITDIYNLPIIPPIKFM